jgi:hypothetical protein
MKKIKFNIYGWLKSNYGSEIANAFIFNIKRDNHYDEDRIECILEVPAMIISSAFVWGDTPEGDDTWRKIDSEWSAFISGFWMRELVDAEKVLFNLDSTIESPEYLNTYRQVFITDKNIFEEFREELV